jgi:hypothetical protein
LTRCYSTSLNVSSYQLLTSLCLSLSSVSVVMDNVPPIRCRRRKVHTRMEKDKIRRESGPLWYACVALTHHITFDSGKPPPAQDCKNTVLLFSNGVRVEAMARSFFARMNKVAKRDACMIRRQTSVEKSSPPLKQANQGQVSSILMVKGMNHCTNLHSFK